MMNATNLDRAQSISAKTCLNATERKSVLPCEATLYIGFFFDGFGRNLVEDLKENRLTNVARLFLAYPGDTKNLEAQPDAHYRRFYISGLGKTFDESLGGSAQLSNTGLDGALNRAKDSAIKTPEDTIKNSPLDAIKDVVTGKKWWESAYSNLKPGSLSSSLAKAVAPATLDVFSVTRDNEITATFFKTGVDTRLEAAFSVLEDVLTKIKGESGAPVKKSRFLFMALTMGPH